MSNFTSHGMIQIGSNHPETLEAYFTREMFGRFKRLEAGGKVAEENGVDIDELIEEVGQAFGSANNYLALDGNHMMSDKMKLGAFRTGLKEAAEKLKKIYFALGGEDVWFDNPEPDWGE